MSDGWIMGVKPGDGWVLHYGAWDDPDHFSLVGFESAFDAWAFLFAHLSIDLSLPGTDRMWTVKPTEYKPKQLRMAL